MGSLSLRHCLELGEEIAHQRIAVRSVRRSSQRRVNGGVVWHCLEERKVANAKRCEYIHTRIEGEVRTARRNEPDERLRTSESLYVWLARV